MRQRQEIQALPRQTVLRCEPIDAAPTHDRRRVVCGAGFSAGRTDQPPPRRAVVPTSPGRELQPFPLAGEPTWPSISPRSKPPNCAPCPASSWVGPKPISANRTARTCWSCAWPPAAPCRACSPRTASVPRR
nr:hypothetical protein [Pandoraea pnomenusa]